MRIIKSCLFSFCLYTVLSYCCGASLIYAQSAGHPEAVPAAVNGDYLKHHLYNGRQFVAYLLPVVGSANHKAWDLLDNSTVVYDGLRYDGVSLMYNVAEDVLIARHPDRMTNIILEKHLVSEFKLEEDVFVRVLEGHPELTEGYYQLIYQSDAFVCYVRHTRTVKVYRSGPVMERRYISAVTVYLNDLRTDDGFEVIRNQRDLLHVDWAERRAVQRLLRSGGLRFRKQPEEAVATVLAYLDESR